MSDADVVAAKMALKALRDKHALVVDEWFREREVLMEQQHLNRERYNSLHHEEFIYACAIRLLEKQLGIVA